MLEVRAANAKLSEGKGYCVLMEAGDFTSFSIDAKKASTSPERSLNRIALAIIQNNTAMKLIVGFYFKINKPIGPTKAFKNTEDALILLRKMRDDHLNELAQKG
jgi:hypothetical protein